MRKTVLQAWVIVNKDGTKFLAEDRSTGPMSSGGYPFVTDYFHQYAVFTQKKDIERFYDMFVVRSASYIPADEGFKIVPLEATVQI